ncbi:MAG: hypothetical protein RJA98_1554 [Pseudomonadota bacterium]
MATRRRTCPPLVQRVLRPDLEVKPPFRVTLGAVPAQQPTRPRARSQEPVGTQIFDSDMSDLTALPIDTKPATITPKSTEWWQDLVAALGMDIAGPLTAALDRATTLEREGHIDRAGLRALRQDIAQARQTGMVAQQLVRLATGRMRQSYERLSLADHVKSALQQRGDDPASLGMSLKASTQPIEVIVDPSLMFGLIDTALDWAARQARSPVEWRIALKTWPVNALLTCRFAHRPADELPPGARTETAATSALDSLSWRLLDLTAGHMGVVVTREVDASETTLTLEFPRTVHEQVEGLTSLDFDQGAPSSGHSRPLEGHQVLVVASRRDMRVRVRDAIQSMGLTVDIVGSVDDAAAFCEDSQPDAIIVEGILTGERFRKWREKLVEKAPGTVFIEIIEEGRDFEMSGFDGKSMARIGRDVIEGTLPSVLIFELSKMI